MMVILCPMILVYALKGEAVNVSKIPGLLPAVLLMHEQSFLLR